MQQKIDGLLVPKLRFPEFLDAGEWKERTLAEFLTESRILGSRGDVAKKITVKLWGKGVYKKNDEIKGSINTQYYRRKAGQFIYSKLDFLNQAFGIISKNLDSYESTVDLPCFDINERLNSIFLLEYVKRKEFYERLGEAADGSRKARRIHADTFLSFSIFVPSIKEQQKIADCLSSISDRITLEAQKLDTLKVHKKGLMQQLFPAEGETLPKLRFPEFQDTGEWEMKKLGDFGEFKNGINFSADKKGSGTLTVDVLNMYGAGIETKLDSLYRVDMDAKDYLLRDGDILFVRSSMKREGIGWASLFRDFSEPVLFCGFLIRLRLTSFELTDPNFLLYYLRSDFGRKKIISISGTAAITNISQDSLKVIPAIMPTLREQQKIADCLSSLDKLIAAQTQAIATLKTHKKGLMQQLFPSVKEVKA